LKKQRNNNYKFQFKTLQSLTSIKLTLQTPLLSIINPLNKMIQEITLVQARRKKLIEENRLRMRTPEATHNIASSTTSTSTTIFQ
jgi:hypothetical protein